MLTTLSAENRIKEKLRALGMSENEFAPYNHFVTKTRFYNALRGEKCLSRKEADGVLELISEMEALQRSCGLPIRWSESEIIQTALVLRRVQQIALELFDDHRFDEQAERATASVPKQ